MSTVPSAPRRAAPTGALLLSLAACSADAPTGPAPGAASLRVTPSVSAATASAVCGAKIPVSATVVDARNRPVRGFLLTFHPTAGGGRMFAGAGLTSDLGVARDSWTLGMTPGPNAFEARSVDAATGAERSWPGSATVNATIDTTDATVQYSPLSGGMRTGVYHAFMETVTFTAYDGCGAAPGDPGKPYAGQPFTAVVATRTPQGDTHENTAAGVTDAKGQVVFQFGGGSTKDGTHVILYVLKFSIGRPETGVLRSEWTRSYVITY